MAFIAGLIILSMTITYVLPVLWWLFLNFLTVIAYGIWGITWIFVNLRMELTGETLAEAWPDNWIKMDRAKSDALQWEDFPRLLEPSN